MSDLRYDFHVHYKAHARDATGYEEAMVQRAVEVGLDGICFTEHFQRLPDERIAELRTKHPSIKVWSGIEVNCAEGNDIVLFGKGEIPPPKMPWSDLFHFCAMRHMRTCLVHPCRKGKEIPHTFSIWLPQYVEIVSRNTPTWAAPLIVHYARSLDFPPGVHVPRLLVNSDAHKTRHLGAHFNRNEKADELAEFLEGQWQNGAS